MHTPWVSLKRCGMGVMYEGVINIACDKIIGFFGFFHTTFHCLIGFCEMHSVVVMRCIKSVYEGI